MWEGKTHPALRGGLLRRTLLLQEREREMGEGIKQSCTVHTLLHTHSRHSPNTAASCELQTADSTLKLLL